MSAACAMGQEKMLTDAAAVRPKMLAACAGVQGKMLAGFAVGQD